MARPTLLSGFEVGGSFRFDGSPIGFDPPLLDMVVEARPWPARHARGMTVFHRVEMGVIDVALKIIRIPNAVFPVPTLPDINLAFSFSRRGRVTT